MSTENPNFISDQKKKLIDANMSGNEVEAENAFNTVAGLYGLEYARQWRILVLEEHGRNRLQQSFNDVFKIGIDD